MNEVKNDESAANKESLEPVVMAWISVNDRLPEHGQRCVVFIGEPMACEDGVTDIEVGFFYEAGGEEFDWGFRFPRSGFLGAREVTHWFPVEKP